MGGGRVSHATPDGPAAEPLYRDDLTRALAERLADMGSERLPQEVAERARLVLLDTLGAILAGAVYSRPTQVARGCIVDLDGGTKATVLGHGIRVSSVGAALCNGIAAHALELDDSHRYATGYHPGATVVPAALAIAEQEDRSIDALVTAIAVGYEAGGRIGRTVNPSHRYRGFHSTGTVGVFGAAAAAGSILGFDAHRMLMALGVAGSMAGGTFAFLDGLHPTKHLHAGHAAQAGLLAALLVARGYTGPERAIEGEDGFLAAYADEVRPAAMLDGLGRTWELLANYFKPYVACGHSFSAIEAALALRADGLDHDDVVGGRVDSYRAAAVLEDRKPATFQEGQFSLPYLVALSLVRGEVTIDSVRHGLADAEVLRLAGVLEIREDPHMTDAFPALRPALVELQMRDGSARSARVDLPLGMPERPLSRDRVIDKFQSLTRPIIGADHAAELAETVLNGHGSVRDLTIHRATLQDQFA